MLRLCGIVIAVALLSAGIAHLRDANGQRAAGSTRSETSQLAWVRTVDGWEPSRVLQLRARPAGPPALHPGLVATLQLGVSLFALLAVPPRVKLVRKSW